jgi:hypothetical protein
MRRFGLPSRVSECKKVTSCSEEDSWRIDDSDPVTGEFQGDERGLTWSEGKCALMQLGLRLQGLKCTSAAIDRQRRVMIRAIECGAEPPR